MNDDLSSLSKRLEIVVDASNPALLQGLEVWLRLGLINEAQVKRLSQVYLTCPIPEPVTVVSQIRTNVSNTAEQITPQNREPIPTPRQPANPNLVTRILQGLKDELSVRWLLFLGLFLVVVSSTLLAATQWNRFTNIGQYLTLFTYTVIFWATGFWLSRKENLHLTSQTLQNIAFLLIPINFWAMDTFQLWNEQLGWIIITLACLILTVIFYQYSKSRHRFLIAINFLMLSYLHWGWSLAEVPIFAVYFALIFTSIILRLLPDTRRLREVEARGLLVYGLTILLIRAIFVVHVPIQQLGLAIGVCGWLLQGNYRLINQEYTNEGEEFVPKIWEAMGISLLLLGWLFSVGENFPWQATVISVLALQFFGQRLRRDWLRWDLLAIFVIGLQGVFLVERLMPLSVRQDIFSFWINITQNQSFPTSIYSLIFFPYLLIFVLITDWLDRREQVPDPSQSKHKLANFSERLSLILGMAMTLISLLNLTARFFNLFLCTLLAAYLAFRRQQYRITRIYFTHLLGLLTIFSGLDWLYPSLDLVAWINILLGLTVIEWAISTLQRSRSSLTLRQIWYHSCWHIGFFLAFLSYFLLSQQVDLFLKTGENHSEVLWWLVVPLTLTGVASRTKRKRRRQAAFWSCFALMFAQPLILWQPAYRLLSLGFGAVLMLFNTYYLRRLIAARIQIGFTLALQSLWIGRLLTNSFETFFTSPKGIIIDAFTLILLWLLNIWLKRRNTFFANLYSDAAEGWAIFLCIFNLLSLTIDCLGATINLFSLTWHSVIATILIGSILIYRYWDNFNYWVVYGVAWVLEILVIQSVVLTADLFIVNVEDIAPLIATVNIILAFFTLGVIGWLSAKSSRLSDLLSFQALPLIIAMMGIGWRWGHFTAYTGLLMVGAGITGVMVGYRLNRGKLISYLAITGISLGIYELTIYQMRQTEGESANYIIILALITGVIALIYRLLAWFLYWRGYQHYLNLNLGEIKRIGHTHWGIGFVFKVMSLAIALLALTNQSPFHPIIFIASLIIPFYALIQGRNFNPVSSQVNFRTSKNLWVYIGLLDILATVIVARLIWSQLGFLDTYKVLIGYILASFLYYFPWQSWGWNVKPWQQSALLLPTLIALQSLDIFHPVNYFNLLLIAAFYGQIALTTKNIRWTYISLMYLDYALLHWLSNNSFNEPLFNVLAIGVSILYAAQVDPQLKESRQRKIRHYIRIIGSGLICVTALIFYQKTGITPAIISLLTLLTGLGLQIRAFLFVGTITFIMTGIYQLIVVSFQYSFVKWIIGLVVGIMLITVAANFERRREQMLGIWQNWLETLNQWQ